MPPTRRPNPAAVLALGASLLAAVAAAQAAAPASCEARSGARVPTVVELYTSEGCSSCPPADRWLSTLKAGPEVIPLAFHVDYWDQLGWPDRLAQPAFSARQRDWQAVQHTRFVYTPQTILNGEDWRGWPGTPPAARPAGANAPVLRLLRQGNQVTASVEPVAGTAGGATVAQLTGFWALVEDDHRSEVRAGENSGRSLRHDHVVVTLQRLPAWPAGTAQRWTWTLPAAADATHARRLVWVVSDPVLQRPVQALPLPLTPGCG